MNPMIEHLPPGPYGIGNRHWPGLAKTAEEAGELVQAAMKLIASGGSSYDWSGAAVLVERLEDEAADAMAAIEFLTEANHLDRARMRERTAEKLRMFRRWHAEGLDAAAQVP